MTASTFLLKAAQDGGLGILAISIGCEHHRVVIDKTCREAILGSSCCTEAMRSHISVRTVVPGVRQIGMILLALKLW